MDVEIEVRNRIVRRQHAIDAGNPTCQVLEPRDRPQQNRGPTRLED